MAQIIVDHTSVALWDQIPAQYMTAVKKMLFNFPGESHSAAYNNGPPLLHAIDGNYDYAISTGNNPAPAYREDALRISRRMWWGSAWDRCGEEHWWTNAGGIATTKAHLDYCETHNLHITAFGFGWCWDMCYSYYQNNYDPVYGCRWFGSSVGTPEGNVGWGLDVADNALTTNSVCLDDYLNATEEYIAYCATQGYTTKVVFTTGPNDGYDNESGWQCWLKNERIRAHVLADPSRILFDYNDILNYDNSGNQGLDANGWTDHNGVMRVVPMPAVECMTNLDETVVSGTSNDPDVDHIGQKGAIRLAKAIWVLMAKLAGWGARDERVVLGVIG